MGRLLQLLFDAIVKGSNHPDGKEAKGGTTGTGSMNGTAAHGGKDGVPQHQGGGHRHGHHTRPGSSSDGDNYSSSKGSLVAKFVGRYKNAFQMFCSQDARRTRSLKLTLDLALSLVVVGLVFLILTATGQFPTSRANMEAVGVYADYIAKYCTYVVTGLLGTLSMALAMRALRAGGSLTPAIAVLLVALLSVLACLGLTIYLFTKSAEMGAPWWSYLLNSLMIAQRLLFLAAASLAYWTLQEVVKNEGVRKQCAAAHGGADAGGNTAAAAPGCGVV